MTFNGVAAAATATASNRGDVITSAKESGCGASIFTQSTTFSRVASVQQSYPSAYTRPAPGDLAEAIYHKGRRQWQIISQLCRVWRRTQDNKKIEAASREQEE